MTGHIELLEVGKKSHMGFYGREIESGRLSSTRRVSLD